jgi:predicted AAA+ superfamily ATPase
MNTFFQGGYPEPSLMDDVNFREEWMEAYIETYLQHDLRKQFPKLNVEKYQRFIHMLSHLTGGLINRAQISRSLEISESAVAEYLDIANGTFLWRNIPSFASQVSKSVQKAPKGGLRDSGLCFYLQHVYQRDHILQHPRAGNVFEMFIIEELIKGAQSVGMKRLEYYHYRTKNGAEVDFIMKGPFGCLPIEIKFGTTIKSSDLSNLKKFIKQEKCSLGLVINNADHVCMLDEKVIQIPAGVI